MMHSSKPLKRRVLFNLQENKGYSKKQNIQNFFVINHAFRTKKELSDYVGLASINLQESAQNNVKIIG